MTDDGDRHVTSRELDALRVYLDEKFRSQFNKTLLVVGVAVGFIKVDTPKDAGAVALFLALSKAASMLLFRS